MVAVQRQPGHDRRKQSRSGRAARPGSRGGLLRSNFDPLLRRQAANPIGQRRADARRKLGARRNGWNRRSRRLHDAEAQGSGEGHHTRHTRDKLGAEGEVLHNGDEAGAAGSLREGAHDLRRWRLDPPVRATPTPRRGPRQGRQARGSGQDGYKHSAAVAGWRSED